MKTALALAWLLASAAGARAAEPPHVPPPDAGPHPVAAHAHVEGVHHGAEGQHGRTCFNASETREKIISRRLGEPFRLLRGAAGRVQGEALRAKLCRWNDEYVYEISLLRRDGRIVHVYVNATNGQSVGAFNDR